MLIRIVAAIALAFPLNSYSEEIPLNPCPNLIVHELVSSKILTDEGLPKGGIKTPSASTFYVAGAADALSGNLVGSAANIFLGGFGRSARLSDIDHLIVTMNNDDALTPEAAKEKMRVDVMDSAKIAVDAGAVEAVVSKSFKHSLSGGTCEPGKCQVFDGGYKYPNVLPRTKDDGSFIFTTSFGVSKNGKPLFSDGPGFVSKFTSELNIRGYLVGFWQAKTQTIYSSGSACQINKESLKKID